MRSGAGRWISASPFTAALACAALAAASPAAANIVEGAWSPVTPWPLIAVHAVLMPDGRVLSYGTKADGQQTAFYIYDIWDPAEGLNAGHTTLPWASVNVASSPSTIAPIRGPIEPRAARATAMTASITTWK